MELRNNTILITGGTSGIGYELASRLIELDNTVIISGRDLEKLDEAKKRLKKVFIFQSDVSDPNAIALLYESVIKKFPELNILINNAGIMRNLNLQDTSIDLQNITREIETNLSGTIRMVQQFLPHLKTKKSAAIINVSSGLAFIPFPIAPIYGATKAGIHSYTQSLRVQLSKTNIKVFELAPPATNTPLNDAFTKEVKSSDLMDTAKMVNIAIKGLKNDTFEIRPGLANVLKLLSRIAPKFALNFMTKAIEKERIKAAVNK